MFAVVDCNNFFVSCERVFRPDLEKAPVMVLSNNDGCVVSRSQEVKALGIPMGAPVFKYKEVIRQHNIQVFSANFALYSDMSVRVMRTLAQFSDQLEVYSIDEAFLWLSSSQFFSSSRRRLAIVLSNRRRSMVEENQKSEVKSRKFEDIPTMDPDVHRDDGTGQDKVKLSAESLTLTQWGFKIRDTIKKWTGIPVSVGIAPTKTLAKAANELAKQWEFFGGVLDLSTESRIDELLSLLSIGDVWGIGWGLTARLEKVGIRNALQLKQVDDIWARKKLGVIGSRTIWELRGKACFGLNERPKQQTSIISSRSFGKVVTSLNELGEAVALYVSRAAEKLRDQGLVAGEVRVWVEEKLKIKNEKLKIGGDRGYFRNSYSGVRKVAIPTSYTPDLIKTAWEVLDEIFSHSSEYRKAGVMLGRLSSAKVEQLNIEHGTLNNEQRRHPGESRDDRKRRKLMQAMDEINEAEGATVVEYAATGLQRNWKSRREYRSPRYTTEWDEMPKAGIEPIRGFRLIK